MTAHLNHSQTVRTRRNPGDRHLAAGQIDEEENQIAPQSFACPDLNSEELRRYDQFPMPLEERFPTCVPAPLGCWFNAVPPQDVGDGAAGTFTSQVGQCTLNPAVTPIAILFCHANHQPC
jgi:hypothetical protein